MSLPTVRFGVGTASELGKVLVASEQTQVFAVVDPVAFRASGAETTAAEFFDSVDTTFFSEFEPNPRYEDVMCGVDRYRRRAYDAVIAIGGGSTIDVAKSIRALANSNDPAAVVHGEELVRRSPTPLIAVPTTAGTGSEATQFAVVYMDGTKFSLDDASLQPDVAIVDPRLTRSAPRAIAVSAGLDAFCQAVESIWSVQATEESIAIAETAASLSWKYLPQVVGKPGDDTLAGLCHASHFAGRAINLTRTTAPHALSYKITSEFQVPHGFAVALTLAPMLAFNFEVSAETCTDSRGPNAVRTRIDRVVRILGAPSIGAACERIHRLLKSLGAPTTLREVGIQTSSDVRAIVDEVNMSRLANNPRRASRDDLRCLLTSLLNNGEP